MISLTEGKKEEIKAQMDDLRQKRVSKQPLEYPSAGSTFKRPEGYFAGKLIQDSGLKGFTVGGAQVSEKHSGFVINKGNATAADVMELIRQVTAKVKEDTGVTMEPEVKQIGEFRDEIRNCNGNVRSREKYNFENDGRHGIFLCG